MRSLERLVSDHHRRMYGRDRNCSVLSEEEVSIERIASEVLSSGVCGVCVCVCIVHIIVGGCSSITVCRHYITKP